MDNDKSKKSAHSAAVARYNAKNYKTFSVNMKPNEYEKLMQISARCGAGKSRILIELLNNISEDEIVKLIEKDKELLAEIEHNNTQ